MVSQHDLLYFVTDLCILSWFWALFSISGFQCMYIFYTTEASVHWNLEWRVIEANMKVVLLCLRRGATWSCSIAHLAFLLLYQKGLPLCRVWSLSRDLRRLSNKALVKLYVTVSPALFLSPDTHLIHHKTGKHNKKITERKTTKGSTYWLLTPSKATK